MRFLGIRKGDILILLICSAILIFGAFRIFEGSSGDLSVDIKTAEGHWVYPLSENLDIEAGGPLGFTSVHIEDDEVWVSDSPCRDKICVKMGRTGSLHGWIACLPNRVFIRIIPSGTAEEGDIDGVTF